MNAKDFFNANLSVIATSQTQERNLYLGLAALAGEVQQISDQQAKLSADLKLLTRFLEASQKR